MSTTCIIKPSMDSRPEEVEHAMVRTLTPVDRERLASTPPHTVRDMVLARAGDPRIGLVFEDRSYSHAEVVDEAVRRANLLLALPDDGPRHVGLLLDNVPDFAFWLAGAALAGAAVVPLNPTRRGDELRSNLEHLHCRLLVTEARHRPLLDAVDLPLAPEQVFDVDDPTYAAHLATFAGSVPSVPVESADPFLYVFTSGSTGAPKACRVSHGRLTANGKVVAAIHSLTADDVLYEAMPFFHSSILVSCWTSGWSVGARHVMRRRFSASNFLDDVRRTGSTYFGYVGKPLAFILATPEGAADRDNPLRSGQGNEGSPMDIERFQQRFDCEIRDGYGSTEGCITIARTDGAPFGSLGRPHSSTTRIVDPATGQERPPGWFDANGSLTNPDEAIGELVDTEGAARFEGYYENPAAEAERIRGGWYWSGDLAFRDDAGWIYFAGRNGDMIRVDGENLSTAVIERILDRHPDLVAVAAWAVPAEVGDDLMVGLQLRSGRAFDPAAFEAFLDDQADLGTKMRPRYVRVSAELPLTASQKIDRRSLRLEGLRTHDPVWLRQPDDRYAPLAAEREG
jgi:fatty-acyl-CoA synthase